MNQPYPNFEAFTLQTEDRQASPRPVGRRRWWHPLASGVALLLVGLGVGLGSASPAHAQDIQCGSILGPGGRYRMQADLECSDTAITVQGRATLDMAGHRVTCRADSGPCVVLTGEGARLLKGVVDGDLHESIVLEGTGGHRVQDVTSTTVDANIIVRSDRNTLVNVYAASVYSPAFIIQGHRNLLTDSTALCPQLAEADGCITVMGHSNRVIGNLATSEAGHKITIEGDQNLVRGNRALYVLDAPPDQYAGILVSGTGNRLEANTAMDNLVDLVDTHGDCLNNFWGRNSFVTSDPACISGSDVGAPVAQLPQ